MTRRFAQFAIAALAALTLTACGSLEVIHNVEDAPVPAGASSTDVRMAIQRAGSGLGWIMREDGPGRIDGRLLIRKHTAEVEIPYSSRGYSILYKDSEELRQERDQIHNGYNRWIRRLDHEIQVQLNVI